MSPVPALTLRNLSKTFPGQVALDQVSIEVRAGEVHCLLGQNGSGKSTLIKVLAGFHSPDPGATVSFDGSEVDLSRTDADWRERLRFIHQDLGLVSGLSVVDNLALGRGFHTGRLGFIRWEEEAARARRLLEGFGVDVDVTRPVSTLGAAQKTMVAIARAVRDWDEHQFRVLVLDEPTSSLPVREIASLFKTIRLVVARGAGVIFVTHRLDEALEIGDCVSVLRDGRLVASEPIGRLDHDRLVELIVGRRVDELYAAPPVPRAEQVKRVCDLSGAYVRQFSLELHRGEIVGVAGLVGSGRDDIGGLIFGARPRLGGVVVVGGATIPAHRPRRALQAGVAYVPGDRTTAGVISSFAVRENLCLPALRPLRHGWRRGWWMQRARECNETRRWVAQLDIRPAESEGKVETLSGGNQQKVVLAKWLRTNPRVLLLDEPTQGVDVGAKAEIYRAIAEAAALGLGVVMASTDASELAHVCDRVLVMRDGAIAAELGEGELTEERIAAEMLRASPSAMSDRALA